MTGYYDVVLGAIPVAMVGITAVVAALGLSITSGVLAGSVASIGVIGHAMFVNGPIDDPRPDETPRPTAHDAGGVQAHEAD